MNTTNSIPSLWGNWAQGINKITTLSVNAIRSFSIIGGIIAVNVVDIVLGALALSLIITQSVQIGNLMFSPAFIAWSLSIATTGIQTAFWDQAIGWAYRLRSEKGTTATLTFLSGATVAFLLAGAVMMVVDTVIDISVVGWLMDGESPKLFLSAAAESYPMRSIITTLLVVLLGLNEPITLLMLRVGRKGE